MRRNSWLKILVAVNLSIIVYLTFHNIGRNKQSATLQGSESSNLKSESESVDSNKNFLRQIFNVVHSSFDGQNAASSSQKQPETESNVDDVVRKDPPVVPDPELLKDVEEEVRQQEEATGEEGSAQNGVVEKVATPSSKLDNNTAEQQVQKQPITTTTTTTAKAIMVKPAEKEPVISSTAKQPSIPSSSGGSTIECTEKDMGPRVEQRSGNYWSFYNYVRAEKTFLCNETITYTTHGEYTFLHNLEPLLKRWQGPLSVALFTPGDDYMTALRAVYYYRDCTNTSLVRDLVTFHFFFPFAHMPNMSVLTQAELAKFTVDCSARPAVIEEKPATYRNSSNLDYPVNVGRNIARETSNSYYIFPSDIELYPSPGLIPAFLDMIRRNEKHLKRKNPRVFVSSIFEIKADTELPLTKQELVTMLKKKIAIPFHQRVCSQCHAIPKSKEWLKAPVRDKMNVFHVAKRTPPYSHWEPIYIGTHSDPYYDERLTWEGRSDKMTQGYQLCVLDYDFMILDNAFLIHRPGIKTKADNLSMTQKSKVTAQNALISKTIMPELKKLYGVRKGCEK